MRFEWNSDKRKKVIEDHSVDFAKMTDIFGDPFAIEFIDEKHSSESELRFALIGLTAEYGLIYLVYTEDTPNRVHFITARKAEKWMVKEYEHQRRRT